MKTELTLSQLARTLEQMHNYRVVEVIDVCNDVVDYVYNFGDDETGWQQGYDHLNTITGFEMFI